MTYPIGTTIRINGSTQLELKYTSKPSFKKSARHLVPSSLRGDFVITAINEGESVYTAVRLTNGEYVSTNLTLQFRLHKGGVNPEVIGAMQPVVSFVPLPKKPWGTNLPQELVDQLEEFAEASADVAIQQECGSPTSEAQAEKRRGDCVAALRTLLEDMNDKEETPNNGCWTILFSNADNEVHVCRTAEDPARNRYIVQHSDLIIPPNNLRSIKDRWGLFAAKPHELWSLDKIEDQIRELRED